MGSRATPAARGGGAKANPGNHPRRDREASQINQRICRWAGMGVKRFNHGLTLMNTDKNKAFERESFLSGLCMHYHELDVLALENIPPNRAGTPIRNSAGARTFLSAATSKSVWI